jgi:hypothetical protein
LDFSNWGALVDAQGWGREVTTCGYGDLQGGSDEDLWYTDTFSGTSSASPIVAGAIAAIQGMARARGRAVQTPAQVRNCLRSTGSPQQDAPGRPASQRIGNRPDIRAFATCAFGLKRKELMKDTIKDVKEFKEGKEFKEKDLKEPKELKDIKEKDLKEHKELKEFKEKDKDKDIFEGKRLDKGLEGGQLGTGAPDPALSDRLGALEQTVQQLVHFIGQDLRPDLGHSALQAGSQAAKDEKDLADA